MAGNNFTNQWNNQALQAKRLENVLGWDYPSQTQQIIATDVTVPYNVNWNTPSYGNQFCGGIKIEKTVDDKFINLKVTLAGASSPTTFLVKTGDFLDVQAISISSDNVDFEETSIVVYMGQASENLFEPFYNNLFQPYYNFDVVGIWSEVFGGGVVNQANFEKWLQDLQGFVINEISDYLWEPIYEDAVKNLYIGRIKCRLEVNCQNGIWRLNDYFYEINGIGDFQECNTIQISNNNDVRELPEGNVFLYGLKEINFKYYSQLESNLISFYAENNQFVEKVQEKSNDLEIYCVGDFAIDKHKISHRSVDPTDPDNP
jgi:hypothetical protein